MLWKEYIEYLSQNTLPKSIIDNTVNVPQQPIYITPYEQAVLNGFKWSEKVFNTKFQIDKKLDETSTAIHQTIDTKIHEIKQKIADQTQNIQSTIQKIEEDLWQFQNIINKRINDTNDKITKKNEITLWKIKEIIPKIENIEWQIRSWTYTPTLYNTTNVASSTAYVCRRTQVGNVVTVAGAVTIDTTTPWVYLLWMSLPVASNLANSYELSWTGVWESGNDDILYIKADTTNNRASINWDDPHTSSHIHHFTFIYEIL